MEINVIGAGLAGSEAALQLAKRGFKVKLYEMRPKKNTGAHKTEKFAEFVCSNSLGASDCSNASGLLKKEMELLGGELINIARECSVPAGNALENFFQKTLPKEFYKILILPLSRRRLRKFPMDIQLWLRVL